MSALDPEVPPRDVLMTRWWTHCPTCDVSFTIEQFASVVGIPDPDEADAFMECPYDGGSLTGWNGDP